MDDTRDIADIDVDDLWLHEWVEEGMARLARYLERHAAFAEFLRERDAG